MNTETTLSVPSIVCGGCAGGIKNALERVPGVTRTDVNIESKIVTVEHDEVPREKLVEVLDKAGFPAS
jgi:copper chaperone CopZ